MNATSSKPTFEKPNPYVDGPKDPRQGCDHHKDGPDVRNLIVCIDGTANQFGQKNTNVIEFYNLLKKEDHNQLTWYNSGIGTYARPSWKSVKYYRQVIDHKIDLAIAWNFERTVLAAYRWLSDNYQKGDRIFLFGFSRGAYQVRVLSAMIDKVGLIHKGNEEQIAFAYELYADPDSDQHPASSSRSGLVANLKELFGPEKFITFGARTQDESQKAVTVAAKIEDDIFNIQSPDPEGLPMAAHFKRAFSHDNVVIHFVGAWDTVSSIGVMRGKSILPGTVEGMGHVCYFRHALALDERRVKFSPEYAYGGSTVPPTREYLHQPLDHHNSYDLYKYSKTINALIKPPHTLEVWFAGTHSDIGGGNVFNKSMDRSRPPLRWMVFESSAAGLRTQLFDRILKPSEQIDLKESLTGFWWLLEMLPLKRLTFTRKPDGKKTTYKPHLGSPRKIHAGQKIHFSLTRTDQHGYKPKALPPLTDNPDFWNNIRSESLSGWRAHDLFEETKDLIKAFIEEKDSRIWDLLRYWVITVDGRQAVYDALLRALVNQQKSLAISVKYEIIRQTIKLYDGITRVDLQKVLYKDTWQALKDCWHCDNPEYMSTFAKFRDEFIEPGPHMELDGHSSVVSKIVFSSNGETIVSASWDMTVRIWDSETGNQTGIIVNGHRDYITDVSLSHDGKVIASASADKTVLLWNATTGEVIGAQPVAANDWVNCVAFSPDGKIIASGSDDQTLRIWDVSTSRLVREHKVARIGGFGIAFHPNSRWIAFPSKDDEIDVRDVETFESVGEPLIRDGQPICLTFSPDGKYLAVGSVNRTILVWDMETRSLVRSPFAGHSSPVQCLAFSPDSCKIVSGDSQNMALLWDIHSLSIQSRFPRHTYGSVRSVAFCPDGKRIASAGADGFIKIWDSYESSDGRRVFIPSEHR